MVLGIRPEILSPTATGRFSGVDNVLNATITVVEPLGDKMDVYVQTPAHEQVVCRVELDRNLREGMSLALHVNMERVHIFEPGEAGVNVGLNSAGDRVSATQRV